MRRPRTALCVALVLLAFAPIASCDRGSPVGGTGSSPKSALALSIEGQCRSVLDGVERSVVTPQIDANSSWILAPPYAVNDDWLRNNTRLDSADRDRVVQASQGVENVMLVTLNGNSVESIEWLAADVRLAGGATLVKPGTKLGITESDVGRRFELRVLGP